MNVWSILVCGGDGTRMGTADNKTLLPLLGIPSVCRCIRTLRSFCGGIVLVVRAGEESLFRQTLSRHDLSADRIVEGGRDRQESVWNGLCALPEECDTVLVHDGARPLVSPQTVEKVLESVSLYGSGVAALPARDTVKRADENGTVLETPDRSRLYTVQTPQGFKKELLVEAHRKATLRATDDAALIEALPFPVQLVEGNTENIKLTSPEDVPVAEALLGKKNDAGNSLRIGHGFDAHRLINGRDLFLGGVRIPHETGLLGHSDADAALHALTDALLGAAALGDIGSHFPDTDEKYRGISSLTLLEKTAALLFGAGYTVVNTDITVIAQRPKLAPYIQSMRENIAGALGLPVGCVSVKATTTERMGFTGREEGIAAEAVAMIKRREV